MLGGLAAWREIKNNGAQRRKDAKMNDGKKKDREPRRGTDDGKREALVWCLATWRLGARLRTMARKDAKMNDGKKKDREPRRGTDDGK